MYFYFTCLLIFLFHHRHCKIVKLHHRDYGFCYIPPESINFLVLTDSFPSRKQIHNSASPAQVASIISLVNLAELFALCLTGMPGSSSIAWAAFSMQILTTPSVALSAQGRLS